MIRANLILDLTPQEWANNNIFKKEVYQKYIGAKFFKILKDECINANISIMTSDLWIASPSIPSRSFVLTEQLGSQSSALENLNANFLISMNMESPIFLQEYYSKLNYLSSKYKFILAPSGASKYMNESKNLISIIFPIEADQMESPISFDEWNKRKEIVSISSNRVWRINKNNFLKVLNKDFTKNLYKKRIYTLKNLKQFYKDVDLFGKGWQKYNFPQNPQYYSFAKSIWKGECENKYDVYKNYKFCIAFENTVFPGYITEKIFDAIVTNTIPIYYGSDEIYDHISHELFIDAKKLSTDNLLKEIDSFDRRKFEKFSIERNKLIKSEFLLDNSYSGLAKKIVQIIEDSLV